ncbi:MAG: hypothetical protein ABI741_10950 [Ferruginibacter sp.]
MSRIKLDKLIFTGTSKQPAVLQFTAGLNVITGPSDTGKSLIFECISYVLGSSAKPKTPNETRGYTTLFLSFTCNNKKYTLERSILSNDVKIYYDEYDKIKIADSKIVSGSANAKENISEFLMGLIGIENKKLKKNDSNEIISLTFNVLKNVILIDELKIQSKTSPFLTGIPTSATSEKALFRFLLTGVDYSDMIVQVKPAIRKADANARIDVLRQLIEESFESVDISGKPEELEQQKNNLAETIESELSRISQSQQEVEILQEKRKASWDNVIQFETKIDQRSEIFKRFTLLSKYYQTDLERLDSIIETGEILSADLHDFLCPLCGAESKYHRPDCVISENEIGLIKDSCEAEKNKIKNLKEDLERTIDSLTQELQELSTEKNTNESEYKRIDALIREILEPTMLEQKKNLRKLFETKTKVEMTIATLGKIQSMQNLIASAQKNLKGGNKVNKADKIPTQVTAAEASPLLVYIEALLKNWKYPNIGSVGFSEEFQDIVIGGQNRSDQGKGFRAVSHAAIIIGLMEYSLKNNLPHPGFVVLDSPLVTFKGADKKVSAAESLSDTTKAEFYRSLAKINSDQQIIILENDNPPSDIINTINYLHFTKTFSNGRFGFIPVINDK